MGYKVDLTDEVRFDGRLLQREKKEYVLLNKPKNFITTTKDEKGRRTVMELITRASASRLLPVGRLDRNTTGLLLFTNDGDLAKKLTHPKHGVRKIYHVELDANLKAGDLSQIRKGLELDDGLIEVDEVSYIDGTSKREVGNTIAQRTQPHRTSHLRTPGVSGCETGSGSPGRTDQKRPSPGSLEAFNATGSDQPGNDDFLRDLSCPGTVHFTSDLIQAEISQAPFMCML